ncbi:alpha-L-iduronidase [Tribolium castaneum]|uniref:alpha-L-iduronidase n=1 Tax=Tribolium castaneum TaxID=7070 RepID=UPI0030FEC290
MFQWKIPLACLLCICLAYCEITVDVKGVTKKFDHFWESTGLCPPDPKDKIYEFLQSDDEKFNLALIGALPNQGIKQVRIHWLLNLILTGPHGYNFTYLDNLLGFLTDRGLKPRFELMGSSEFLKSGEQFWRDLVHEIASRYIGKFGANEVASWKFELWNEPDLKNYNILKFALPEYLSYVAGCAEGLRVAFDGRGVSASLGGPAGLFREENHPLCWGLLQACSANSHCPIQFISFHRKGGGTAEGVLNGTLELLDLLHNKFPNLAEMPIANDESDIITTWSDSWEWRGDARYAAMVVKVIAEHYKSLTLSRKLKIELLSFDNGFLNYHPFYFTQRTLFARFQMNHTDPPHSQFIKKPVYVAMGLLALLGDEYLAGGCDSNDSMLTVLATRTSDINQSNVGILVAYADSDEVNIETIKSVRLRINNLSIGSRFVVYLLDNILTNPYRFWHELGRPVFPPKFLRQQLREHEGPYRLFVPTSVSTANLNIALNLTVPSVALIHICSKPSANPGPVTKLSISNVTRNEILLTWSDAKIDTKCIRTYEVEFEAKCANSLRFERVNTNDVIFLSYHHAPTGDGACETTIGRYRVRAVDYWDQPGIYSEIVSFP